MRSVITATVAATLAFAGLSVAGGIAVADPTPAPAPAPKTTIDADGTYAVNTEVVPGNYASAGPVGDGVCYWKRTGAADAMLDNAMTKRPQVVAIAPTDASFKTTGCQAWQLTDASPAPATPPFLGGLQAQAIMGTLNGLAGAGGFGQAGGAAPQAPAISPAPGAPAPLPPVPLPPSG